FGIGADHADPQRSEGPELDQEPAAPLVTQRRKALAQPQLRQRIVLLRFIPHDHSSCPSPPSPGRAVVTSTAQTATGFAASSYTRTHVFPSIYRPRFSEAAFPRRSAGPG